eukprot:5697209-Pyramimonas_sp.AAC.1
MFGKANQEEKVHPVSGAIENARDAAAPWCETKRGADLCAAECLKRHMEKRGREKVITTCDAENAAEDAVLK